MSNPTFNNLTVLNTARVTNADIENLDWKAPVVTLTEADTNPTTQYTVTTSQTSSIFILPPVASAATIVLPTPVNNHGIQFSFVVPAGGIGAGTLLITATDAATGFPTGGTFRGSISDTSANGTYPEGCRNKSVDAGATVLSFLGSTMSSGSGVNGAARAYVISDGTSYIVNAQCPMIADNDPMALT